MKKDDAVEHIRYVVDKYGNFVMFSVDVEDLLDSIYEDIDSEICKNCKYYKVVAMFGYECSSNSSQVYTIFDEDFGCNKFEKQKEEKQGW